MSLLFKLTDHHPNTSCLPAKMRPCWSGGILSLCSILTLTPTVLSDQDAGGAGCGCPLLVHTYRKRVRGLKLAVRKCPPDFCELCGHPHGCMILLSMCLLPCHQKFRNAVFTKVIKHWRKYYGSKCKQAVRPDIRGGHFRAAPLTSVVQLLASINDLSDWLVNTYSLACRLRS